MEKERQNNAHDLRDLCGTRIADLIRVLKDNTAFTVSDSEALIHLAYVQDMWQSKFVVILEGLTRWRIELC